MAYLRNCWYAAAWSEELKPGSLLARTLLDELLVLFRDPAGRAVALDDMCPHRLAPLRLGRLLPDGRLQCGYHGLEFDATGQCVRNPHGSGRISRNCRVRAYPLVERHTLAWIWMGDEPPDDSLIPEFGYLDRDSGYDVGRRDTILMRANYRYIVDNLMDLSHASFLHDGLLGNADTVPAEIQVRQDGPYIHVRRAEPALPGLYGARYTLVRPDQHVAWRGQAWPAAGEALFDRVTGR